MIVSAECSLGLRENKSNDCMFFGTDPDRGYIHDRLELKWS